MRYLILGAGVGKAIAYFLSRQKSTDWLVLADMDIDKAKKVLGYEPQVGLEEGLDKFLTWYQQYYGK